MGNGVHGNDPIGTCPYTRLATIALLLVHQDDLQLFIRLDSIHWAGLLAGRGFALLAGYRNVNPSAQLHHPDPGAMRIECAGMV